MNAKHMTTPGIIEEKLKAIKPVLKDRFSVERIGYFGSFARGDYREDSDVDIVVSFSGSVGWKFFDLKDYLESLLNRKVDLVTEYLIRKQWKEAILSQVKYV
jgi:predicted nucleotidyltransferase